MGISTYSGVLRLSCASETQRAFVTHLKSMCPSVKAGDSWVPAVDCPFSIRVICLSDLQFIP